MSTAGWVLVGMGSWALLLVLTLAFFSGIDDD